MTDFTEGRDRDFSMTGCYGETVALTSTDASQSFDPALFLFDNRTASCALITCETYPVRVSFLTEPTFSLGHILNVGDTMRVVGIINLENFKFVSASAGAAGVLQVTFEF